MQKKGSEKSQPAAVVQEPIFTPDDRVTSYTFKFDNGYAFTWHHVPLTATDDSALLEQFDSLYHCMEACRVARKPFMVQSHPYVGATLVAYMVNVRRWTVRRAYKHLCDATPELMASTDHLVQPLRLLIAYESRFLGKQWPSVPFKVLVTHQLGFVCFFFYNPGHLATDLSLSRSLIWLEVWRSSRGRTCRRRNERFSTPSPVMTPVLSSMR